jgi:hypothetical protein
MIGREYLDPGSKVSGYYDPPRRCVVLIHWRPPPHGQPGPPCNVAVRYLDDGTTAVIPYQRRLRRSRP